MMDYLHIHFNEIDSTHDFSLGILEQLLKIDTLIRITSDKQNNGHGTNNRFFYSPSGGIYFTFIMDRENLSILPNLVTIAVGAAIANYLSELFSIEIYEKPVNDVMFSDKKLGGILVQQKNVSENEEMILIGVGLNIYESSNSFKDLFDGKSVSINSQYKKKLIISGIINHITNIICKKTMMRLHNL